MVQPDAVLEVSDGVLNLGVAAMISLQFERLPVPVGDEAVIAMYLAKRASWEPALARETNQ